MRGGCGFADVDKEVSQRILCGLSRGCTTQKLSPRPRCLRPEGRWCFYGKSGRGKRGVSGAGVLLDGPRPEGAWKRHPYAVMAQTPPPAPRGSKGVDCWHNLAARGSDVLSSLPLSTSWATDSGDPLRRGCVRPSIPFAERLMTLDAVGALRPPAAGPDPSTDGLRSLWPERSGGPSEGVAAPLPALGTPPSAAISHSLRGRPVTSHEVRSS